MTEENIWPLDVLTRYIELRANKLRWSVRVSPPELSHTEDMPTELARSLGIVTGEKPGSGFEGKAYFIEDSYAVRVVTLPNECNREHIKQFMERLHLQLAVDRGHLPHRLRDDLYLFLVAPWGSDFDQNWRAVAGLVERDELICRKSVWLPPIQQENPARSVEAFLDRTFMGRPWDVSVDASPRELDPLERLVELAAAAPDIGPNEKNAYRRWIEIALASDDSEELAMSILQTEQEGLP